MDDSFNYDNIKIEFSSEKKMIKADGAFFKGGFMTHKEVVDYIEELSQLQLNDNFEREEQRKSNAYFLGLLHKLDEKFHFFELQKENE